MGDHLIGLDARWSLWRQCSLRSAGLPIEFVGAFAMPDVLARPATQARDDAVRAATAGAMWSALADDTFMAALTWQNPGVVDTWAARLAAQARAGDRPAITRRNERERVVARYAQRYATKNESIGFFGPVSWATFTDGGTPIDWSGDLGIRTGTVSYEVWAVANLARAWAEDPRALPYLPVRLDPACSVHGTRLRRPRRGPAELDGAAAAVLAALRDGQRWADLLDTLPDPAAARAEELRTAGVLRVGFTVPFDDHPEAHLRRQVAEIPDEGLRDELTGRLDRLDLARDQVHAVMADPVKLHPAMRELADGIVAAGGAAQRPIAPGGLGRTAVYLDCRRDLDVRLGAPLVDKLRAPLGILLDSAQWLAAQVSDVVVAELTEQYRRLRRDRGTVTLAELQSAVTGVLVPGNASIGGVLEDFQLRWAEIVPATGVSPVHLDAADVRPVADVMFPGRAPGWAAARRHTPDLMLYREPDGRYRWVLGELHVALNTMESRLFATQSDDRDALVDATAADFPSGRVVPVYPHDGVASNSRTYPPPALDPPGRFRYWSFGSDDGHPEGARSVPATAIRVEESGGTLVGIADGWQADVTEFFGEFLTALCVNLFKLRTVSARAPRVLINDLVICRESWSFPAGDVPLPRSRTRDYTYGALRDWARSIGLPRHVFVQSPVEVKPVYVDFAAPALVDNLARLVRAAEGDRLTVTEMLPGPDQLWLTDAEGRHYTSEFRVVAVGAPDPAPVLRPNPG